MNTKLIYIILVPAFVLAFASAFHVVPTRHACRKASRDIRFDKSMPLFLSKEIAEDDKVDKVTPVIDNLKKRDYTPLATADQIAEKEEGKGFDVSKVHWTSW